MPVVEVVHDEDPAERIFRLAGNLDDIKLFNNQVLIAVYKRPNKMILGGKEFYMPDKSLDEDDYQSKTGLIIKMGRTAFIDPTERWFSADETEYFRSAPRWAVFRPSEGWNVTLTHWDKGGKKELLCRQVDDTAIKMAALGPTAADRVY